MTVALDAPGGAPSPGASPAPSALVAEGVSAWFGSRLVLDL